MRVGITGVPGTGKTTIARRIAEAHSLEHISISRIIEENKLWTFIDPSDDAKIVNLLALKRMLQDIPDNCIVESHLLCEIYVPLDKLIVLRTPIKTLEKRLNRRKYGSAKIKSNLYSELLDYCTEKAMRRYSANTTEIYEVLTSKNIEEVMKDVRLILKNKGKNFRAPWVDISKEF